MTILERLSLIKAGYNRKEIDAMIEEEKNIDTGTNSEGATHATTSHDATVETPAPASSGAGAETASDAPDDENTDSTDAALKNAMEEIERLKGELKTAQEFNTKKDASETVDDDAKTVEDIVRSFM